LICGLNGAPSYYVSRLFSARAAPRARNRGAGCTRCFRRAFGVIGQIDRFNSGVTLVREAQLHIADLQRLQSDEESAVRGFAATHDPAFRDIYRAAVTEFPVHVDEIAKRLAVVAKDNERGCAANWRANAASSLYCKERSPARSCATHSSTSFRSTRTGRWSSSPM
jgi:hypothetical protein